MPYRGEVKRLVSEIEDGVRSAMSYVGAFSIADFQEKSTFVNAASAGIREAFSHGLLKSWVFKNLSPGVQGGWQRRSRPFCSDRLGISGLVWRVLRTRG